MPFDPSQITSTTTKFWWEVDQLAGPVEGQAIAAFADHSANALNFAANSGAPGTYHAAGPRGNGYVSFLRATGNTQFLQSNRTEVIATFYVVARVPQSLTSFAGFALPVGTSLSTDRLGLVESTLTVLHAANLPTALAINGITLDAANNYPMDPIQQWKVYRIDCANAAAARTYLIAACDASGGSWDIAAVLGFAAGISPADDANLVAYLTNKYVPAPVAAGSVPAAWASPGSATLVEYIDATESVYTDLDGTAAATDGQAVALWRGRAGNGIDWWQADAAHKPVFRAAAVNGRPGVQFTAASVHEMAAGLPAALEALKGQSYSVAFTVVPTTDVGSTGANKVLSILSQSAGGDSRHWYTVNGNGWQRASGGNAAGGAIRPATKGSVATLVYTFQQTATDTGTESWYSEGGRLLDGQRTGAVPPWNTAWPWWLANLNGQVAGSFDGHLLRVAIYQGVLSVADIKALQLDAMQAYEVAACACEGDSRTAGNGSTLGNDWPSQAIRLINKPVSYVNIATGGDTAQNMVTTRPTELDPYYRAGQRVVGVFAGGLNDIFGSATASTVYGYFKAWGSGFRSAALAAGASPKLVFCTIPPDGRLTSGQNAQLAALNASILGAVAAGDADAVVDTTQDPHLGASANTGDATIYVDGTHWTDLGSSIFAGLVAAVVGPLLVRPATTTGRRSLSRRAGSRGPSLLGSRGL